MISYASIELLARGRLELHATMFVFPKDQGGLEFREVLAWNNVVMFECLCDLSTMEVMWAKCVQSYKLHNQSLWNVQSRQNDSRHWKKMLCIRDEMKQVLGQIACASLAAMPRKVRMQCVYQGYHHSIGEVSWHLWFGVLSIPHVALS